jgi:hypothetical protein
LPGRSISANSCVPIGGNTRPSGAGVRPEALATAAISIDDFVPSRNELNICGFMPPVFACSGVRP